MKLGRILGIALLTFAIVLINVSTHHAYGLFDDLNKTESRSIKSGTWQFTTPSVILDAFNEAFLSYFNVDTVDALYTNQSFLDLLEASSTTGNVAAASYSLENVFIGNYSFDINGVYERQSRTSLGFLRPLNYENENNAMIYPLKGEIPQSTDDDPFTVTDVKNALSEDSVAFRLDNEITITTHQPIENLSAISFYALMGNRENGDDNLAVRPLVVSVGASKDGPFETIGTFTIERLAENDNLFTGNLVERDFPYYHFELSAQLLQDMPEDGYYVRLFFAGGIEGRGGNVTRSRVIIDNLEFLQE